MGFETPSNPFPSIISIDPPSSRHQLSALSLALIVNLYTLDGCSALLFFFSFTKLSLILSLPPLKKRRTVVFLSLCVS
ncbi:hypothetical protein Scep_016855 [Stephania cephalantha]|uniref:Uncharacterized protein n=1 Tax=Stephania cephalantha TaxID=152367 RepID=A0AAP0NT24_9MAGN